MHAGATRAKLVPGGNLPRHQASRAGARLPERVKLKRAYLTCGLIKNAYERAPRRLASYRLGAGKLLELAAGTPA